MRGGSHSSGGSRSSGGGHSNTGISTNRQSSNRSGSMYGPAGPRGSLPNYNRTGSSSPEYNFSGGFTSGYGMYYGGNPYVNVQYMTNMMQNYPVNLSSVSCPNPYTPCSTPLTVINNPGSNFNFLSYE